MICIASTCYTRDGVICIAVLTVVVPLAFVAAAVEVDLASCMRTYGYINHTHIIYIQIRIKTIQPENDSLGRKESESDASNTVMQ